MSAVRVKICGITSVGDALYAAAAGADAIGLNFVPASPRRLSVAAAREIRFAVPPFVAVVGIFVDESAETVLETARAVGLTAVQLHGEESPQTVAKVAAVLPVIKAFRVRDRSDLEASERYPGAQAYLFDTYAAGAHGGTGRRFNWALLEYPGGYRPRRPWILAGGLTPENVEAAIRACQPYSVDVASGVEASPGVKDAGKVSEFIRRVRRLDVG